MSCSDIAQCLGVCNDGGIVSCGIMDKLDDLQCSVDQISKKCCKQQKCCNSNGLRTWLIVLTILMVLFFIFAIWAYCSCCRGVKLAVPAPIPCGIPPPPPATAIMLPPPPPAQQLFIQPASPPPMNYVVQEQPPQRPRMMEVSQQREVFVPIAGQPVPYMGPAVAAQPAARQGPTEQVSIASTQIKAAGPSGGMGENYPNPSNNYGHYYHTAASQQQPYYGGNNGGNGNGGMQSATGQPQQRAGGGGGSTVGGLNTRYIPETGTTVQIGGTSRPAHTTGGRR